MLTKQTKEERLAEAKAEATAAWNRRAPQSGWISVDVRLPPKDVEVLVYTPASVQKVCLDEWGTHYECPVSFSTVTVPTGDGWLGHEFEEVTHWMEIPLPPSTKGESANG